MSLATAITRTATRQLLHVKKQSPHILFIGGLVGTVTSTVLACRATLKLSDTLEDIQKDLANLEESFAETAPPRRTLENEVYEEEYIRAKYVVYAKGSLQVLKLYAPSAIIGAVSIGCLTTSHVELSRRNAALMAAYAAVQEAYENYRERVRAQLGEERELELYHGVETEIVKIDGKNKEIKSVDPNKRSMYARFFDEYSTCWDKDPELNRLFISCQQQYANERLRMKGHLFLNEVYDWLGFERTKAGSVVGWVIEKDGTGDNFVDFGLYEVYNNRFLAGIERSVLLDFNVDGVIYDKI